ncbi:tRNA lysidine(34) synthetase TilS [Lactobacillus sp. S2-2]|uniref:tRNA lysidine(34) synthetase TilS n=1 Tax=Lactobacillus sp. S2-2 TaxID=2692917 RepID=UPI001F0296C8|nr:tRNA lysidine(34) synthetase TilS [Lactobacillus sp. S2-2]MCF6515878.1 tRNA lysidine(34) synthetase TilS [Lactobacillus sp. S2-2]
MDLFKNVELLLSKTKDVKPKQKILLAVSTGVDSMVMLDIFLKSNYNFDVSIAYVNHHLREQSEKEKEFIIEYCKKKNLNLYIKDWPKQFHPDTGIEEAARNIRYNFFADVLLENQIDLLLTAHHKDDQAETFLMKAIRSGNLEELKAIEQIRQFKTKKIFRPFLNFRKQSLRNYAKKNQLIWFEDESNYENDFFRNRIRNNYMKEFELENSKVVDHFANISNQVQEMNLLKRNLLKPLIEKIKIKQNDSCLTGDLNKLLKQDELIQKELLKSFFKEFSFSKNLVVNQINEVIKLLNNNLKPQGLINLGNGFYFEKSYEFFAFKNNIFTEKKGQIQKNSMVVLNHWMTTDEGQSFGVFEPNQLPINEDCQQIKISKTDLTLPLFIRKGLPNDTIQLSNGGHQKLKRILINKKVKSEVRNKITALVDSKNDVLYFFNLKAKQPLHNLFGDYYILLIR